MLSLLDGHGRALACMMPPTENRAGLHLAQARHVLDERLCVAQAGVIVQAKLRNQYALLKRLNRRRALPGVSAACEAIKRLWYVDHLTKLDDLRGREGDAAQRYWVALGLCLDHGFGIKDRRVEIANPVLAVLDWLSHMITRDMAAAICEAGLHPGFGFLHATGDRREALAYDLVEVFRAPLCEGLAVYLFNNRMLARDDFTQVAGRARVSGAAARRVVVAYEQWLARPIRNPRDARMTSWRMLIRDEARAFAASLGKYDAPAFVPYRMDW